MVRPLSLASAESVGPERETGGEALPPLRDDVELQQSAPRPDGSPSWVLIDTARHMFFRIGWAEFEILSRWHLASIPSIVASVTSRTALDIDAVQVDAVNRFLDRHNLIQRQGSSGTSALLEHYEKRRKISFLGAFGKAVFVRIPIWNPDDWLSRNIALGQTVLHPAFWFAIACIAISGLVLAIRQWDTFLSTFPNVVTTSGVVAMTLTLVALKIIHELGHAVVAKHYRCRVPTIGVAFFFGWPVMYTDVTDAWRLTRRRPLVAIASAGMLAEIAIGSICLLLWSFMPDSGARTIVFLVATTSWILTLVVNLNPLMRFDGYFLLSDALGVDNMQDRSFTFTKWVGRRCLFGVTEPSPEAWTSTRAIAAVTYAISVWMFRGALLFGIALVAYEFAFQTLGVLLFVLCIYVFLCRPILNAISEAWEQRGQMRLTNTLTTAGLVLGLGTLLFWPISWDLSLPAVAKPVGVQTVYSPAAGEVVSTNLIDQNQVAAGDELIRLRSPDTLFEQERLTQRLAALQAQRDSEQLDDERRGRSVILEAQIATTQRQMDVAERRLSDLRVTAPIGGVQDLVAGELRPGTWIAQGQPLSRIVNPAAGARFVAYISERDQGRLAVGSKGTFWPRGPMLEPIDVILTRVDIGAASEISEPALTSDYGGPIATWRVAGNVSGPAAAESRNRMVPDIAQSRTIWAPAAQSNTLHTAMVMQVGTVRTASQPISIASIVLRQFRAVLRREFGL